MTEDEMVGWYHRLKGHEFEQTLGDSDGEGSLTCCSPWDHKEKAMTYQLKSCRSLNNQCCKKDTQPGRMKEKNKKDSR